MPTPAGFALVHHVGGGRKPAFAPTRLASPVTYIGRTAHNDVVLPSDNVSRRHAKVIVTDMGVTVHDLDSHNGIFLNGKKVRSSAMNAGDLLYVADVCIELTRSADPSFTSGSPASGASSGVHGEIAGEEDSNARSLATLLRASALAGILDDDAWNIQAMELCRELTEATVAVLVWQSPDGLLEAPVVLQPEAGRRPEIPVLWPLVQKALDEGLSQFSPDLKREPLTMDEAVVQSDVGAVMVSPVMVDGQAEGVIYLARPLPSPVFTERELETVAAVTQLFALRQRTPEAVAVESVDTVEPHGDTLALQAKAEAAEERLREAQADVRGLTERIHGLEAEALKLKQQIEIERQGAVDARREAERGRLEATRLEQGLHKTDEDVKKLKDGLARADEDRARLRESLRTAEEERRARTTELERLKEALQAHERDKESLRSDLANRVRTAQERDDELQRVTAELARLLAETGSVREELQRARSERAVAEEAKAAAYDALRASMRSVVPTSVAEHIEASADGAALVTDVAVRPVAALFLSLRGFDGWAVQADPAEVKRRLDHFCNSVALRARANGGRVEQVLGHSHLVLFPADATSVRAAIRCGIEIAALVPTEDGIGVVSALHVAPSAAGFFGEGDAATRVEAGEAVLVSRSVALMLAHEPAFYVSDAVQKLVAGDPAFSLAILGPAALVGAPSVVLFKVMSVAVPFGSPPDGRPA